MKLFPWKNTGKIHKVTYRNKLLIFYLEISTQVGKNSALLCLLCPGIIQLARPGLLGKGTSRLLLLLLLLRKGTSWLLLLKKGTPGLFLLRKGTSGLLLLRKGTSGLLLLWLLRKDTSWLLLLLLRKGPPGLLLLLAESSPW